MISLSLLLPFLASAGAASASHTFTDGFERGLCLGRCDRWNWAASQQIDGVLDIVPGRGGKVLRARTGPRRQRVPKAALIARPAKLAPGSRVRIAFDVMVPMGAPLNSIHLVDVECASCGEAKNPGIRLYLRHGRLRVDRAKIGVRDAWTNDNAPQLRHGRWHGIEMDVAVGFGSTGGVRVRLDGAAALEAKGDTVVRPAGRIAAGADRIQIGLTASSNPVPAVAFLDNVRVAIVR